MLASIVVRRLTVGTVLKVVVLGSILSLVPFSFVMGLLSFFGASTVKWNGQPLTGISGVVASPFIGLFVAVFLGAVVGLAAYVGLWIYSLFRPIELHYVPGDTEAR